MRGSFARLRSIPYGPSSSLELRYLRPASILRWPCSMSADMVASLGVEVVVVKEAG